MNARRYLFTPINIDFLSDLLPLGGSVEYLPPCTRPLSFQIAKFSSCVYDTASLAASSYFRIVLSFSNLIYCLIIISTLLRFIAFEFSVYPQFGLCPFHLGHFYNINTLFALSAMVGTVTNEHSVVVMVIALLAR